MSPMNWKEELKDMKLSYLERYKPLAFKELGGRTMAIRPYRERTTRDLIAALIDYFQFTGGKAQQCGIDTVTAEYKTHTINLQINFSTGPLTEETVRRNVELIDVGISLTLASFGSFLLQWEPIKKNLDTRREVKV